MKINEKEIFEFIKGYYRCSIEKESENKYRIWVGGGSIGSCDTIEEARIKLFKYIKSDLKNKIKVDQNRVSEKEKILTILNDDVFNLGKFKKYGE